MFAELPVGIADPAERLESLRAQMDGLKQSKQAVAGDVLTSLSGFAPPMLLALGARLAATVAVAGPADRGHKRPRAAAAPATRSGAGCSSPSRSSR